MYESDENLVVGIYWIAKVWPWDVWQIILNRQNVCITNPQWFTLLSNGTKNYRIRNIKTQWIAIHGKWLCCVLCLNPTANRVQDKLEIFLWTTQTITFREFFSPTSSTSSILFRTVATVTMNILASLHAFRRFSSGTSISGGFDFLPFKFSSLHLNSPVALPEKHATIPFVLISAFGPRHEMISFLHLAPLKNQGDLKRP